MGVDGGSGGLVGVHGEKVEGVSRRAGQFLGRRRLRRSLVGHWADDQWGLVKEHHITAGGVDTVILVQR